MYCLYVGVDYTYIDVNALAQGIKSFLASHVWSQAVAGVRTYVCMYVCMYVCILWFFTPVPRGGPTELFLVPTGTPRHDKQRPWYVLSCHIKYSLLLIGKCSSRSGSSRFPLSLSDAI